MKHIVIECDGCKTDLSLEPFYHEMGINFNTFVNDKNINQSELNSSMNKNSSSVYCEKCFDRLISHIESFVKESEEMNSKKDN